MAWGNGKSFNNIALRSSRSSSARTTGREEDYVMLKGISRWLDRLLTIIEDGSLLLSVAGALIVAMINIILRKTTDYSLYWSDEVVRKVIYFTTYMGCVAAVRSRALIRIDVLPQMVKALKKPLDLVNHLAVLAFAVCMVWLGWGMTKMAYADPYAKTSSLQIPEWYFYALLPLVGGMMVIRTVLLISDEWCGKGEGGV
jgi:TRAP-type C4-dicarboxylate transport system permease small subunit